MVMSKAGPACKAVVTQLGHSPVIVTTSGSTSMSHLCCSTTGGEEELLKVNIGEVEVQFGYSVLPCWLCSIYRMVYLWWWSTYLVQSAQFLLLKVERGPGNETNISGSSCLLSQLADASYAENTEKKGNKFVLWKLAERSRWLVGFLFVIQTLMIIVLYTIHKHLFFLTFNPRYTIAIITICN